MAKIHRDVLHQGWVDILALPIVQEIDEAVEALVHQGILQNIVPEVVPVAEIMAQDLSAVNEDC